MILLPFLHGSDEQEEGVSVGGDEEIAFLQPGLGGGRVGEHAADEGAEFLPLGLHLRLADRVGEFRNHSRSGQNGGRQDNPRHRKRDQSPRVLLLLHDELLCV